MSEEQPLFDLSIQYEAQPQTNPFYQAVEKNQQMWRDEKHGILQSHEMPSVSQTVEENMKLVFSGYVDPSYPRVIVARTILQDRSTERFYNYTTDYTYSESMKPEDERAYEIGIFDLNEWATNYATRYYLEKTSKTPISKPLRRFYGQLADTFIGKTSARQTYKVMAEVKKLAKARDEDFDHAVFQGLFQHDFTGLNDLIADTTALPAANLEDLAILIGNGGTKKGSTGQSKGFMHTVDIGMKALPEAIIHSGKYTDPQWKKSLRAVGQSVIAGGQFATPGIAEVGFGNLVAAPLLEASVLSIEQAVTHTDPTTSAIRMGIAVPAISGVIATFFPFITFHESVHAYSAADNYIGFMPSKLYLPSKEEESRTLTLQNDVKQF
jgi:hypothetical protein